MKALIFGAVAAEAHIAPCPRVIFSLIVKEPSASWALAQPLQILFK